ncbi:MAG: threonine/serine exporter family protein [Clostridia bacterium]|nr:threonine/serine exporter family protein [Clostridia bacterium]
MTLAEFVQILTGGIGSLGFAVLFNIRGKRVAAATVGGLLSWFLFVIFSYFTENEPLNYFFVAMLLTLYAEIMARVLKTPTTTFITTSLIPLIPGGSLYYTMAYAFSSDSENFILKGTYTLQLASALALGIIVATTISRISVKKTSQK